MISDSYLRKSTADAGKSVTRQEKDWATDCLTNGYAPGRAFIDPDLSASRYARHDRPDFAALTEHIRSGGCQMLSMWEASRGARNMAEWVGLLDLCRRHNVMIRIFGGSPETYDPRRQRDREALLHEGIASERESETISERSKAGARHLAASGKPPGPMLFGYTRAYDERGKFVSQDIHAERAALMRRFRDRVLAGESLNSLAEELNGQGTPSPKGGRWTGQGIRRLLLNPGYLAKRVHNGEVITAGVWEPLFDDDDDYRRMVALLRRPDRRTQTGSGLAHELSGAARCGKCGGMIRTHGRTVYVCITNYDVVARIDSVNQVVSEMVRARLRSPDAAAIFAPRADGPAVAAARRELAELEEHLAGFVEQAAEGKLSATSLAAVEARVLPKISAARRRVSEASVPATLAAYAGVDVAGGWAELAPAVRREFILDMADVVLGSVGKGGRWSIWRLAESRWRGDARTWGDIWRESGY